MGLGQLDAAIRLGAITTILLLAWLLFRRREAVGTPAWLFLPLAVCLSVRLPDRQHAHNPAARFRRAWSRYAFRERFDRRLSLVVLPFLFRQPLQTERRGARCRVGLGFGIVAHLIWRLASGRKGDLIQRRYDARIMVAILLGGQLLIDLSADMLFGFGWRPLAFAMAQNIAIFAFGLWMATKLLAVRADVLTFGSPLHETSAIADDALRLRLSALIENRIFLDPELTFAAFVQHMGAPERSVRKLVNHQLGFDHFRTFLNHYRMQEARRLLADPRRAGDKLIAIALDSGFASLPSFNRVFRAAEGCSPSRYREAALAASSSYQDDGKSGQASLVPGFEQRSAVF